ncbi:hypothetical protein GUJ93_ZPchr0013g37163 [Zizania palustris]|uniref:Uncharacterized protein n=1 Tax=Zizania palustris TaxID=103762 RepID=A0A8J5X0M5_ZIZPA|nr:hypothetical protein GUJ93_ZPchr0013g37163 [Zizania palustris]
MGREPTRPGILGPQSSQNIFLPRRSARAFRGGASPPCRTAATVLRPELLFRPPPLPHRGERSRVRLAWGRCRCRLVWWACAAWSRENSGSCGARGEEITRGYCGGYHCSCENSIGEVSDHHGW